MVLCCCAPKHPERFRLPQPPTAEHSIVPAITGFASGKERQFLDPCLRGCYLAFVLSEPPVKPKDNRKGLPPFTLREWVEFCWLSLFHHSFRNSRNKRRTYYEYRLARNFHTPCE